MFFNIFYLLRLRDLIWFAAYAQLLCWFWCCLRLWKRMNMRINIPDISFSEVLILVLTSEKPSMHYFFKVVHYMLSMKGFLCFFHPIFRFLFLVTFDNECAFHVLFDAWRSVEIVVELGKFVMFLIFSWKKSDRK